MWVAVMFMINSLIQKTKKPERDAIAKSYFYVIQYQVSIFYSFNLFFAFTSAAHFKNPLVCYQKVPFCTQVNFVACIMYLVQKKGFSHSSHFRVILQCISKGCIFKINFIWFL